MSDESKSQSSQDTIFARSNATLVATLKFTVKGPKYINVYPVRYCISAAEDPRETHYVPTWAGSLALSLGVDGAGDDASEERPPPASIDKNYAPDRPLAPADKVRVEPKQIPSQNSPLAVVTVTARSYVRPMRPGYIYVHWADGMKHIWHEYEVLDVDAARGHLHEIEWKELGKDVRPANGSKTTFMRLPQRDVEIAFSEIQWCWARIIELERSAEERGKRMRKIDLRNWPLPDDTLDDLFSIDKLPAELPELSQEHAKAIQDERQDGVTYAAICIHDALGDARQCAANYQGSWLVLEHIIEQTQSHKWFPCASTFVSLRGAARENREMQRQLEALDDEAIDQVLQREARAQVRDAIEFWKESLVKLLVQTGDDGDNKKLIRLVAAVDDYVALPVKPPSDGAPCYESLWDLTEQLLVRLDAPACSLDAHLDPDGATRLARGKSDIGLMILESIADPDAAHPLHFRLFPPLEDKTEPPKAPRTSYRFHASKAKDMLKLSRSALKVISKFVSCYAKAGMSAALKSKRSSLVTLMYKSGFDISYAEITLAEFVSDPPKVKGAPGKLHSLASDELLIRHFIDGESKRLKPSEVSHFDGDLVDLPDGARGHARVLADGKLIGSVSAEDYTNGRGFSRTKWKKLEGSRKWLSTKVRVVVMKKPAKDTLARWGLKNANTSKYVARMFGVLEAFNLYSAIDAVIAADKGLWSREGLNLFRASIDAMSYVGSFASEAFKRARLAENQLTFAKFVGRGGRLFIRAANGLGLAGGVVGGALSAYDMYQNIVEDDDAKWAHMVLAVGGLASAVASGYAIAGISAVAGPLGWIAAGITLVGVLLLQYVFREDTDLEIWIKDGPFHKQGTRLVASKALWNSVPAASLEALLNGLYGPSLTLECAPTSVRTIVEDFGYPMRMEIPSGNKVTATLRLPYLIENVSRVEIKARWTIEEKLVHDQLEIRSIDLSMQSTNEEYKLDLALPRPVLEMRNLDRFDVELRVRIDVYGDGRIWLPPREEASILFGRPPTNNWITASGHDDRREF